MLTVAHELHSRRWCAHFGGSVSARVGPGRFLITPARCSLGAVADADLVVVTAEGVVVSGVRDAARDLPFHLETYRARADVAAVALAQPPSALGLSVAGGVPRPTVVADAVVSLGTEVPKIDFAFPGERNWSQELAPALEDADAVLLDQKGVLAVGAELESVLLRIESVEHVSQVQLAAAQAGRTRELSASDIQQLLKERRRMGWGAAGRHDLESQVRTELPVVKPKEATADGLVGVRTFAPPKRGRIDFSP
ncbi:MAG: class II aldolase/adducin family protein [Myxococcota bacterium]